MDNINKYYNATQNNKPHKNVKYFIDNIKGKPANAVDLGCDQGNDTLFLIKHGWNVLGIDRENVEDRIRIRLKTNEQLLFNFKQQNFENLTNFKADLIIANFSLSFCNNKKFNNTWKTIENSLQTGGYFVGNLFAEVYMIFCIPLSLNFIYIIVKKIVSVFFFVLVFFFF